MMNMEHPDVADALESAIVKGTEAVTVCRFDQDAKLYVEIVNGQSSTWSTL